MEIKLYFVSVLGLGWERISCPLFISSNLQLCIGADSVREFPSSVQQFNSIASFDERVWKTGRCCACTPMATDHHLHTCATLGDSFQFLFCTLLSPELLVKVHDKELASNCEPSLYLGIPIVIN